MNELYDNYGHKTRIRACVLITHNNSVLLTGHKGMQGATTFWSPPGGGLQFGESLEQAAIRELKEETGLAITTLTPLSFVSEFIAPPLHAIEVFYWAELDSLETVQLGYDPEFDESLLTHVEWMTFEQVREIPNSHKHHLFHQHHSLDAIRKANGIISLIK